MNSIPVLFISALCSLCLPCFADTRDYGENLQNLAASRVLKNIDGSQDHWQGIGRLEINGARCTATLLDTRDELASPPTPAYVLTAGHCIELTNGNIVTDKPVSGTMQFNFFADIPGFKSYPLKAVVWRSMQGVDLAIVELEVSLQKLIDEGIQPLKLARDTPANDTDVLIVGAPTGFEDVTLRMAACTLQPALEIVEGAWVWRNTFMTRCQDIRGGSSGSPLLDRYTNEIVGVIGTGNFDDSIIPCRDHAPCTPVGNVYLAVPGNVYGNPTAFLNGCFLQGRIAKNPPSSCQLYPAFTVDTDANKLERYKRVKQQDNGSIAIPTWNYRFSISTAFYRHKGVRTAMDCESPHHYSDAVSSIDTFINSEIGTEPGFYFLCILGVDSLAQEPESGLLKNALSLPVEVLENKPTSPPDLSIKGDVNVTLAKTAEPYRTYSIKFGPAATTDCHQPEKYVDDMDMDFWIDSEELPGKLCSIAYDKSGQASEPRTDLLSPVTGIHKAASSNAQINP
ncbi:trypsin-like peptidase domain-containing protein [Pseudomonas sp. P154a]|uniref:trypsin-like serine peptidase n=1 Tax=Pseudomonas mucoides TaxID=2730424 RepID=UPI001892600F|nr:serine protease [Pseudomonas mucoides]MBF6042499.1 trypsin-like peptidase domain-containing protein [Pseudomonas mucoides]